MWHDVNRKIKQPTIISTYASPFKNHPFALYYIYDSGVGFVSFLGKIFE